MLDKVPFRPDNARSGQHDGAPDGKGGGDDDEARDHESDGKAAQRENQGQGGEWSHEYIGSQHPERGGEVLAAHGVVCGLRSGLVVKAAEELRGLAAGSVSDRASELVPCAARSEGTWRVHRAWSEPRRRRRPL